MDVVQIVVEMPMTGEVGTAFVVEHVVGHIGKPQALILTLLQGSVKVGHPRSVGCHGCVFLVGAETLDQLSRQFIVAIGETIGIGDLGAVKLQPAAIRS